MSMSNFTVTVKFKITLIKPGRPVQFYNVRIISHAMNESEELAKAPKKFLIVFLQCDCSLRCIL